MSRPKPGSETQADQRRRPQKTFLKPKNEDLSPAQHADSTFISRSGELAPHAGTSRRKEGGQGTRIAGSELPFEAGMLFEGRTVEAQAEMLQRMPVTQQQAAIRHIGRVQGNRHVQRVVAASAGAKDNGGREVQTRSPAVGMIQTKLTVGEPDDAYEQEADQVAEQVMRMPAPAPPPPPADDPSSGEGKNGGDRSSTPSTLLLSPSTTTASPAGLGRAIEVEEEVEPEEESELVSAAFLLAAPPPPGEEEQAGRKSRTADTPTVDAGLEGSVQRLKGGGRPLPSSERAFFEPRFGADFSSVRVHSDATAAQTAQGLNARAYTMGSNVVFGSGEYAPGTPHGRQLLAHELTHVVQQGGAGTLPPQRWTKVNRCITPDCRAQAAMMKRTTQGQKPSQPHMAVRTWVQGKPNRCTTPDCLAQEVLMQMPLQQQIATRVPLSSPLERKPNRSVTTDPVQTTVMKARAPFQRHIVVRAQSYTQLQRKPNRCTTPDCQTQTMSMKIAVQRKVPGGPLEIVQQSPADVPQIQRIGGINVSIPNPFAGLIDSLKEKARAAGERIREGAQNAVSYLGERGTTAWNNIKERGANAWNDIRERGTNTWETLKETAATSWATVKERSGTAWEEVKSRGAAAWETVQTRATTAWETVQERAGAAAEMVQMRATALYEGLQNGINTAVEGLRGAWESLKTRASTAVTGLWDRANDLVAGIRAQVEDAVAGLQERWTGLKEYASELVSGLQEQAQSVMKAAQGKLGAIASAILSMDAGAVQSGWAGLQGMVEGAWQGLQEMGGSALGRLREGWGNLRGQMTETLSGLGTRAQEMLGNLRGMAQTAWEGLQGVWEGLKGRAAAAFEGLKARAQAAWEGLKSLGINAWNGLKALGTNAWSGLETLGTNAWNGLKALGTNAWNELKALGIIAWNGIRDRGTSAWTSLKSTGETAWNNLKGFGEALWGGLKGEGEGKVDESQAEKKSEESGIRGAAGKVMNFLGSILSGLESRANPAISNLIGKARDAWTGLKEKATGAWTGLKERATGAWNILKEKATGAWMSLREKATGAWTWLKERATGAWMNLKERATGAWTWLKDRATDAWTGLRSLATDAWNGLKSGWNGLKALGVQAWEGIKGGWETLKSGVSAAWNSLKSFASDAWGRLKGWAISAWEGIEEGWGWFKGHIQEQIEAILNGLKRLWKKVYSFSIDPLIETINQVSEFIKALKIAAANPEMMIDPFVDAIAAHLGPLPGEAQNQAQKLTAENKPAQADEMGEDAAVPREGVPERTRASFDEVVEGVKQAITEQWSKIDVWKIVKQALFDFIMPIPGVIQDLDSMFQEIGETFGRLFSINSFDDFLTNLSHLADIPLIIWRYINSICGRLSGWFLLFCVVTAGLAGAGVGGVIGTIGGAIGGFGVGAAPGGAGGGLAGFAAGAGAGAAFAGTVGLGLLGSCIAAETASAVKAVGDLFLVAQTPEEKAKDYGQFASSAIGLGAAILLTVVAMIAAAIVGAIVKAVRPILPKPVQTFMDSFSQGFRTRWQQLHVDQSFLDRLPTRSEGDKTTGIPVMDGDELPAITSGRQGPAQQIPRGTSGYDLITRTHVEGHTAAHMRLNGVQSGTLYINNPPCTSCNKLLPRMLPEGSSLRVVWMGGEKTYVSVP